VTPEVIAEVTTPSKETMSYPDPMPMKLQLHYLNAQCARLEVPVRIDVGENQGYEFMALVDTGAHRSFLNSQFIEKFVPKLNVRMRPFDELVVGASGNNLTVKGQVDIPCTIGQHRLTHNFIVAELPDLFAIVGIDYLNRYQATWDYQKGGLVCGVDVDPNTKPDVCSFSTSQAITIPGRSAQNLTVRLKGASTSDCSVILQTEDEFVPVLVPSVVNHAVDGQTQLLLINQEETAVTIPGGTTLGRWEPLSLTAYDDHKSLLASTSKTSTFPVAGEFSTELEELYARSSPALTEKQKELLRGVLWEYQDVFASDDKPLGRTQIVRHYIDTAEHRPIKQSPRRVPIHREHLVEDALQEMQDSGVIRPSESPWSSPIVLVRKKDGNYRFCVDYRKLNECTVKDAYPLPRIEDNLDAMQGARWFSSLDLQSGYWQVEMEEVDKEKTAFTTKFGLWEFNVMPFGLCNAPATFQRLMEQVLMNLQWKILVLYLDDVVVYASTVEEHLKRLEMVFQRLRSAGLQLKSKKCDILKSNVAFLGHIIDQHGVHTDPDKVQKVVKWPIPDCVRTVRSFIGLTSYYRRYIKDYAQIARPLHQLTQKGREFEWTVECEQAFRALKEALVSNTLMAYPRRGELFILDTDASGWAIGAVLSQLQGSNPRQEKEERVVAYGSRCLNPAEVNYCTTRRELLAIVYFAEYFRHFLLGCRFVVRTDHGSLRWLMQIREPSGQVARWIERLASFDMEIQYRKGEQHGNADAMSRIPCPRGCTFCTKTFPEEAIVPNEEENESPDPVPDGSDSQVLTDSKVLILKDVLCSNVQTERKEEEIPADQPRGFRLLWCAVQEASADLPVTDVIPSASSKPVQLLAIGVGPLPRRGRPRQRPWTCTLPLRKDEGEEVDWSAAAVALAVQRDPILSKVYTWRVKPQWEDIANEGKEVKHYWAAWKQIRRDSSGLLWYRWVMGEHFRWKLILPPQYQFAALCLLHDAPVSGHLGMERSVCRLQQAPVYWYHHHKRMRDHCRTCDACQLAKPSTKRKPRAPMKSFTAGEPMERVAVDILGPLRESAAGNVYVLVFVDYFTKWVEIFALADHTAETVATCLIEHVFSRFGLPLQLHSDQGTEFMSELFRATMKLLGITQTRTTPWRPQSDGMVERMNRTLETMLRQYVDEDHQDWDRWLPYCAWAYRSSIHSSTRFTPNKLMLGREVWMPLDLITPHPEEEDEPRPVDPDAYVDRLRRTLEVVFTRVRENLRVATKRQKREYDRELPPQVPT